MIIRPKNVTVEAPDVPGDVRLMNQVTRALCVVAILLMLVALLMWVSQRPMFALRGLQVTGDVTRNNVATLRANVMPALKGNFFTVNLQDVKAAFETVPWVRKAMVHRVWPNRLSIELEEHQAAAIWVGLSDTKLEDGEEAETAERLLNTHGEVFEANVGAVEDDGLPRFEGLDVQSGTLLATYQRWAPLFDGLRTRVDQLSLSKRQSWSLTLDTGAQIVVGRGTDEELYERLQRFLATQPQIRQKYQRPVEYADLRHRDGYAVRLRGVSTLAIEDKKSRK